MHVQGNSISQLEGFSHLRSLLHLDLSHNRLAGFGNLSALTQLRHLNLDCNHITFLAGLLTYSCHNMESTKQAFLACL